MNPSRVFAMGDLQYNSGKLTDFNVSYQNSWGAFKSKSNPVVGTMSTGPAVPEATSPTSATLPPPASPLQEGLRRVLQLRCGRRQQQVAHRRDQRRVRTISAAWLRGRFAAAQLAECRSRGEAPPSARPS